MGRICLLCCLMVVCPALLSAQHWEGLGLNVGAGNPINDFVVYDNTLYASVFPDGIKRSTDEGKSWDTLESNLRNVIRLVPAGDRLYAATYNNWDATGLLYYTTDGGKNWTLDTAGAHANFFVPGKAYIKQMHYWDGHLAVIFDNADAYYIRSINSGEWRRDPFLVANDPGNFASIGSTLIAAGAGINYTTDYGANWTKPANAGLPPWWVAYRVFTAGERIYIWGQAYNTPVNLFYSDDMGASWTETKLKDVVRPGLGGQAQTPTAMYGIGDSLWVAVTNDKANTTPDILFSTDRGETFALDTLGLPVEPFGTIFATRFLEDGGYLYAALNGYEVVRKRLSSSSPSPVEALESPRLPGVGPNPARDSFVLFADEAVAGTAILTDLMGREALRCSFHGQTLVTVSDLSPGTYVLVVYEGEKKILTKQIIIGF